MYITYEQPAFDKKTRQPKRYHHKVQSGCLVCRRRRIKCDETKPTCVRCQKYFSECIWPVNTAVAKFDEKGYRDAYFHVLQDLDLYRKVQRLGSDKAVDVGFGISRSIDLHQGSWQDRRCLDYYLANITTLLPSDTAAGPEAQLREVCLSIAPCFAQYSPTVRHAIAAEAWADESHMRHGNTSATLVLQRDRRYQATVQALLKTDLYIEEILLCCVLLYSYACFVRDPAAALVHVQSGLKMIEEQQLKVEDEGTESRRAIVATIEGALKCMLATFNSIFPSYAAVNEAEAEPTVEPFESTEAAHKELRKIIIALAAKQNMKELDTQLRKWHTRFENPATPRTAPESDLLVHLHQTTQYTWRLLTSQRNHVVDQSRLTAIHKQLAFLFSQQPVAIMTDAVRLRDIVREMTLDINSGRHNSTSSTA